MTRATLSLITLLLSIVSVFAAAPARAGTISVMAPLLMTSEGDWSKFRDDLKKAKAQGVDAIETDVWWGVVEGKARGQFDWSYYRRLSSEIKAAGLKWTPILSTHQCGGNVGDTVNIPLPGWIWDHAAHLGRSFKFKSEGGNETEEFISFWDTPVALDLYKEFYAAFRNEFTSEATNIAEVIVSAGPAGEMHYPSYNAHDRNLDYAGYPNRGALQASSDSAIKSFRRAMLAKYGSLDGVSKAWGGHFTSESELSPPTTQGDVTRLFGTDAQFSAYGQDLFDWYRDSMLQHVRLLGDSAMTVFGKGAFAKTGVGFKMAGVHWSMNDRLAELTTGAISTRLSEATQEWNSIDRGLGYRPLVETVAELQRAHPAQPVTLYFTSGMTPNGDNNPKLKPGDSRAQDESRAISKLLHEHHVQAGFENALDFDLSSPERVGLIHNLIHDQGYSSASFLRLGDVVKNSLMWDALPHAKALLEAQPKTFEPLGALSDRSLKASALAHGVACERLLLF